MIGNEELAALCRVAALDVAPERQKLVLENLQRMEQVAGALDAVELAPEDELGPQWRP